MVFRTFFAPYLFDRSRKIGVTNSTASFGAKKYDFDCVNIKLPGDVNYILKSAFTELLQQGKRSGAERLQ